MIKRYFPLLIVVLATTIIFWKRPRAAAAEGAGRRLPFSTEVDAFWEVWESGRPSEAIRRAAPTPDMQTAWTAMGRAADAFNDRAGGKSLGHTLITQKPMGDSAEYVSYFAMYEPTPLRVEMLYCKPKDKWTLVSIRVDNLPNRWLSELAGDVQVTVDSGNAAPTEPQPAPQGGQ